MGRTTVVVHTTETAPSVRDPITGTIEAYISDQCPECAHGDLDLTGGRDGRWEITWEFVPCRAASPIEFLFENFNNYYWKIQPRGMASPTVKLTVDGRDATSTNDNHWEANLNGKTEATVVVTTLLGEFITSRVRAAARGVIRGGMIRSTGTNNPPPAPVPVDSEGDDNENDNGAPGSANPSAQFVRPTLTTRGSNWMVLSVGGQCRYCILNTSRCASAADSSRANAGFISRQ